MTEAPPSWTNNAGTACYGKGQDSSFLRVAENIYWSSSTWDFQLTEDGIGAALRGWNANLILGVVSRAHKTNFFVVWPVRGGTR